MVKNMLRNGYVKAGIAAIHAQHPPHLTKLRKCCIISLLDISFRGSAPMLAGIGAFCFALIQNSGHCPGCSFHSFTPGRPRHLLSASPLMRSAPTPIPAHIHATREKKEKRELLRPHSIGAHIYTAAYRLTHCSIFPFLRWCPIRGVVDPACGAGNRFFRAQLTAWAFRLWSRRDLNPQAP